MTWIDTRAELSHAKQHFGPIFTTTQTSRRRYPARSAVKLWLDRIIAIVALILLAPLMVMISLALVLEGGGPVLFRQHRIGLSGRKFLILKFRTMRTMEDGKEVRQATRQDDRTTDVGQFLRRTSLDELPQLVNVLRGEMSLVGPRPHAVAHDRYYSERIKSYKARQLVRPGLTGWAQVNGCRGATPNVEDMARRVEHDLWYIANWSPKLDARILLQTVALVVRQDPAAY